MIFALLLIKTLSEGKTFKEFSKELKPTLQKKGWWGEQIVVDSAGVAEKVQLGSMYQSEKQFIELICKPLICRSRYATQIDNAENPTVLGNMWLLWINHTRPEHAMLNGLVYRYDDPFWQSFYPPNGWNCRCQ